MQYPYRQRTADHMFREVQSLYRQYRFEGLSFLDLAINADVRELERFCDLVIDSGIEFTWGGQALIRPEMDDALLTKMARAGCTEMTFGLESFSQVVVDAMSKRFSVDTARRVLQQTRKAGIDTAINLVVGFPGETPEAFAETLKTLTEQCEFISRIQAVNACHLTYRSRIAQDPEQYGIRTNGTESWFRWEGPHGNTYEVRKHRMQVIEELLDHLGLGLSEQNAYDEGITPERD
jgi:hypothetical protein